MRSLEIGVLPLLFCPNEVIYSMLIHPLPIQFQNGEQMIKYSQTHLPRKFFILLMPLQYFPENHSTREDVYLIIVLGVRSPQFRGLPVDRTDKTANHRPSWLFNLCQSEVGNFCHASSSNKDVGRFAITVNDRWLSCVKVFQATGDVKHELQLYWQLT